MKNIPEAAHHHSTSSNSIKSIIEIRIPIEGFNSRKILKWTEKSNTDLMTSLTEESSTKKKSHLLKNLAKCSGKEAEPTSSPAWELPWRSKRVKRNTTSPFIEPKTTWRKCRGRMDGSDCLKPFPHSLCSRRAKGLNGLKIRCQTKK